MLCDWQARLGIYIMQLTVYLILFNACIIKYILCQIIKAYEATGKNTLNVLARSEFINGVMNSKCGIKSTFVRLPCAKLPIGHQDGLYRVIWEYQIKSDLNWLSALQIAFQALCIKDVKLLSDILNSEVNLTHCKLLTEDIH